MTRQDIPAIICLVFTIVLGLMLAGAEIHSCSNEAGDAYQDCYKNKTCNDGLACVHEKKGAERLVCIPKTVKEEM